MIAINEKYRELVEEVKKQAPFEPEIALVLGSGLGDFAKNIDTVKSIPTSSLPNYPVSTVQGHEGYIHFSEYKGKKLLIFQGRIHFYEGYKLSECILPPHVAHSLGCKYLILTNAAGGINPDFEPGTLMIINSFNALQIKKELAEMIGSISEKEKNSVNNYPSKILVSKFKEAALDTKLLIKEGTYWFSKGPSYETPAEIQMYAKYGNDAVGMSTVHEAIYGSMIGMEVGAISCITNLAAGISPVKLSHAEVMETAEKVKSKFEMLVKRIVELI